MGWVGALSTETRSHEWTKSLIVEELEFLEAAGKALVHLQLLFTYDISVNALSLYLTSKYFCTPHLVDEAHNVTVAMIAQCWSSLFVHVKFL